LRNEYIRRSLRYSSAVRELYDQALKEISMEFSMLDYNPNLVFSFEKFGKFSDVDRIMTRLEQQIQQTINLAIENEFGAAYKAHESLLKQVLGSNVKEEVWKAFAPRISSGNAALLYMTETATDNITHSTRVWNGAVLGQMETAVQQAMMEGMPAKQMAGLIEQYLNDPDSCFRRFRIKTGVDADGKTMYGRKWKKRVRNKDGSTSWFDADPRDYPTGQGVYHSSYKNALRYTRSSTNIAYRTADFERYQTEAFVLGFEIHTTSNPAHKEDICDLLAGRYPKEFKWVGWHPNCYCFQVPILATPEEVDAMADAILKGQDPASVPVAGRVTDVPDNYKGWVAKNEDRIQQSIDQGRQLPYFLRDNGEVVNNSYVIKKFSLEEIPSPSIAMTEEQRQEALMALVNGQNDGYLPRSFNLNDILLAMGRGDMAEADRLIDVHLAAIKRHKGRTADRIRVIQDFADTKRYGEAYVENVHLIEASLGMKRGKRMTHLEANSGLVNPNYGQKGFNINCSTCSPTYILRRMGFNVQAKANIPSNQEVVTLSKGATCWEKWIGGTQNFHSVMIWQRANDFKQMSPSRYMQFIKDNAKEEGIYELIVGYSGRGHKGHSTLIMVEKDGTIKMIDQQVPNSGSLEWFLKKLSNKPASNAGIMRVDNALFNRYYANIVKLVLQ